MKRVAKPVGRSLRALLGVCVCAGWLCGCPGTDARAGSREQGVDRTRAPAPEPSLGPEPGDWAAHVGQVPTAPDQPPSAAEPAALRPAQPATMTDHEYDSDELVTVRHLVYRVALVVPPALRGKHPPLIAPAGELHVDVALERLRARFVGPGWPLDEGSEVRLRADVPGAYLFDGTGGRPLAPGLLASWFQGNEAAHAKTSVRIRREPGVHDHGPGDLMCALLAEWTAQDRDELLPRCQGGAMPPGFRLGLWAAELTAIVPITLPRRQLRADAGDPPKPIAALQSRAMLDPSDVAHLAPLRLLRVERPQVDVIVGPQGAVLEVENRTESRVVVIAQSVPLGWVRAHSQGSFSGFAPGYYRVGAVRPFGQPVMTPTLFRAPGALHLGKQDPKPTPTKSRP